MLTTRANYLILFTFSPLPFCNAPGTEGKIKKKLRADPLGNVLLHGRCRVKHARTRQREQASLRDALYLAFPEPRFLLASGTDLTPHAALIAGVERPNAPQTPNGSGSHRSI